jgi:hypothetical protein
MLCALWLGSMSMILPVLFKNRGVDFQKNTIEENYSLILNDCVFTSNQMKLQYLPY